MLLPPFTFGNSKSPIYFMLAVGMLAFTLEAEDPDVDVELSSLLLPQATRANTPMAKNKDLIVCISEV